MIARMIDQGLTDTQEQYETLLEARPKPWVLDDALVNRSKRVNGEALEWCGVYDQQLKRWLGQRLTLASTPRSDPPPRRPARPAPRPQRDPRAPRRARREHDRSPAREVRHPARPRVPTRLRPAAATAAPADLTLLAAGAPRTAMRRGLSVRSCSITTGTPYSRRRRACSSACSRETSRPVIWLLARPAACSSSSSLVSQRSMITLARSSS